MSDSKKRRRRRMGSSSHRYAPPSLVPIEPHRHHRVGAGEIAGMAAISIVALALILLIWIVEDRTVQGQQTEIHATAERVLVGQAATMADTVSHELQLIDQSLAILQAAWKADSAGFDVKQWQQKMPALMAVTDDLFVADDKHLIRQDILPTAVGQGVGAAYVAAPNGSLETFASDGRSPADSPAGQIGSNIDTRQFLMYIVRSLDQPKGWLIGASYRSGNLTRLFADAQLGINALAAAVDTRTGGIQAIVGTAARRTTTNLRATPLYQTILRLGTGTWEGDSSIDGINRLHAFHRVEGRDLVIVVADSESEINAPAAPLAAATRAVAVGATLMVVVAAGVLGWGLFTLRESQRRRKTAARDQMELERLRTDEAATIARAQLQAARLRALVEHGSDGVALIDSGLRLVQWNERFAHGIGIVLQPHLPLDALVRAQAAAGLFGTAADPEIEIARRVALLRSGEEALPQPGPDEALLLRGLPIEGGGSMLLLSGTAASPSVKAAPVGSDGLAQAPAPAPIEW